MCYFREPHVLTKEDVAAKRSGLQPKVGCIRAGARVGVRARAGSLARVRAKTSVMFRVWVED